ncbi:MAG: phytoene desaturase [Methylibium sp.]|uniref:phytoene desaturase family protein n=1 Tax=Methylibium sp. TaxID=2067992 RepID=UPI0017BE9DFC|nr:phytoene desaturase family protein [Methylibium sp.]MBA3598657.1 phytoene desaturase [Methylibium sp.]
MNKTVLPVAVIGGGLGGLAAAVTLAGRGHRVVLFEANDWLGGKAASFEEEGFRFDMGPTILTLPEVLRRVFAEAGRDMDRELELLKLEPQWRCFFDDGAVLDLVGDVDAMARRIDAFAPGREVGEGYRRYIEQSEQLHRISENFFFWKSVEGVSDTFNLRNSFSLSTLADVLALRMGRTLGGVVREHVNDARIAQLVDHFVQYVGSNPFAAPAVLGAIAHMQTQEGIWYPRGGTRSVPQALERVARELAVEMRTGTAIAHIQTAGGRVSAVVTEAGERVPVHAVVSNMDAVRTYRELLDPAQAERGAALRDREPACSGVVFYLGLDRAYEHLAHHDFVFSRNAEEEFDYIYRRGEPAPDPTCYLAAPARTEPGVAPAGGEALYILVHTPYLRPHHDWRVMLPAYRRVVFDKLARCAGLTDLEDRIKVERHLTPQDIHDRYRVLNGAIYGLASHGRFTGAFKPGNRRSDVPGLYLAGGAAHPGPGMPMVLMSGWIAADAFDTDERAAAAAPAGSSRLAGAQR